MVILEKKKTKFNEHPAAQRSLSYWLKGSKTIFPTIWLAIKECNYTKEWYWPQYVYNKSFAEAKFKRQGSSFLHFASTIYIIPT